MQHEGYDAKGGGAPSKNNGKRALNLCENCASAPPKKAIFSKFCAFTNPFEPVIKLLNLLCICLLKINIQIEAIYANGAVYCPRSPGGVVLCCSL